MVGPQTTRNRVVAIDPHTTRRGVAWDPSLAGTNDDISRFGMMPCCGGVAEVQRAIKRHNAKTERMHFLQLTRYCVVGRPHRLNRQRPL